MNPPDTTNEHKFEIGVRYDYPTGAHHAHDYDPHGTPAHHDPEAALMAGRKGSGGGQARSAKTGRFVTLRYAKANPSTTIVHTKKSGK